MSYIPGEYLVICDICGHRKLRSECRKNWKNQLVCADTCWEAKHPQLSLRTRVETVRVDEPRPEAEDRFVGSRDIKPEDL